MRARRSAAQTEKSTQSTQVTSADSSQILKCSLKQSNTKSENNVKKNKEEMKNYKSANLAIYIPSNRNAGSPA